MEELGSTADIAKATEAKVSRRSVLKGGTAVAVGAAASAITTQTVANAASFNPKKFAGSKVKVLLVDGERDQNGLLAKKKYIKDTYGIEVEVTALSLGAQIEKMNSSLNASTSEYDIIDVLGFFVSGVVGAGKFTQLDSYINDASMTPASYNFPKDFPKGQLDYTSRYDIAAKKFGGSKTYLIPGIHSGSVIMFYREDLLKQAGLSVPKTWDEYLSVAQKLNAKGVNGTSMIGGNDVSLILVDWFARFASLGGKLMSGTPAAGTYTPNLTSAASIKALQNMVDCAKYSPKGVGSFGFTESVDAFSRGDVGIMLCWSTIGGSIFNKDNSMVSALTNVAEVPGSPGRPIRGGWGLGIPKNLSKKRKDAAWMVMQYITSAEFDKYQFDKHQTDPNRLSTYNDKALNAKWPYLKVAGKAMENGNILDVAVIPECFELVGEAAREFNLAILGTQSVQTACSNAQSSWVKILRRAGHLK